MNNVPTAGRLEAGLGMAGFATLSLAAVSLYAFMVYDIWMVGVLGEVPALAALAGLA